MIVMETLRLRLRFESLGSRGRSLKGGSALTQAFIQSVPRTISCVCRYRVATLYLFESTFLIYFTLDALALQVALGSGRRWI
jgi:hypothetical protein